MIQAVRIDMSLDKKHSGEVHVHPRLNFCFQGPPARGQLSCARVFMPCAISQGPSVLHTNLLPCVATIQATQWQERTWATIVTVGPKSATCTKWTLKKYAMAGALAAATLGAL